MAGKINSKAKGKRGELLFRDILRSRGYSARRGAQYCGSNGDPDVVCDELKDWHFEVKFTEHFFPYRYIEQAEFDSKATGAKPVVMYKRTQKKWLAVVDAELFLDLIAPKKAPLPEISDSEDEDDESPESGPKNASEVL